RGASSSRLPADDGRCGDSRPARPRRSRVPELWRWAEGHGMSAPWPKLRRNLVAILRGVQPDEAKAVGRAVYEAGIEAIEVPLNSPDPFRSIGTIAADLPADALVGAGTVLDPADVDRLAAAGGRLLVAPNVDTAVLARAAELSLVT